MRRPPAAAVWTALLAVYFFWGSTYIGIRYAIDSMPPFTMAAVRFMVAGAALFLFARLRGAPAPDRRQWLAAGAVATLLLTIGNGAVVWAEQAVPTGIVAIVVCTSAVWMVLFDRVLNGTRLRAPQVAGIVVGLLGIVVLANPRTSVVPVIPALVLLVSAISWAAGTVLSRRLPLPPSAALGNGMQMLAGGLLLVFPALLAGEPQHLHPERFTAASLAAVLYLAVFGSLVAFSCYLWLIRVVPVALVSTQSYVSPVIAVLLGVLLRGEALTGRELLAGGVTVAAVVLIVSTPLLTSGRPGRTLEPGKAA